jgi:hypothetical protein
VRGATRERSELERRDVLASIGLHHASYSSPDPRAMRTSWVICSANLPA